MADTKQVTLVINQDRKAKWDEFADDNAEYTSLSHLIRVSVENEIERGGTLPASGDNTDIDLSEITTRLDDIEGHIADLKESVDTVETATLSDSDLNDLASRIYDDITTFPDEESADQALHNFDPADNITVTTIQFLAGDLEHSEYDVRQAAEKIAADNPVQLEQIPHHGRFTAVYEVRGQ